MVSKAQKRTAKRRKMRDNPPPRELSDAVKRIAVSARLIALLEEIDGDKNREQIDRRGRALVRTTMYLFRNEIARFVKLEKLH